jgi:predicted Zn-dependent peptidase
LEWEKMAGRLNAMKRVTKQDIIAFAKERLLDDNYVAVYKRQGPDTNVLKVEKPPITAVTLNRESISEFAADFLSRPTTPIAPVFGNFSAHIQTQTLANGLSFDYVYNPANPLFRLDYIFEMGKTSDRALAIATNYLPYLGASQRSAIQIKQELFRLGLSFDATCNDERTYITLSGLEESFEAGLRLLEDLLAGVQNDAYALTNIISDTLLIRRNAKQDRNVILRDAMGSYARYGPESPFTFRLSEAELNALQPDQLTSQIRTLNSFAHRIYYYGQKPGSEVARLLEKYHHPELHSLQSVPESKAFAELETPQHQVLFVDFPIVQADVLMVSKGSPVFNPEELLFRDWYNEYFGYGLSSIVFQEIREAKALAYSTYAMYSAPSRKDRAHYLRAYVGTQPDKLADALPALLRIIEHMPVIETQIEHARQSLLRRISTERVLPSRLYWTARSYRDLGIGHDFRRDIYERLQNSRLEDLLAFQQQYVKGRAFTFLVLGSRKHIDMELLASFGPVRELSMEEVFGY